MANSQTAVFKFESDTPIRSVIIAGEPWFVAHDVCTALRIQNVTQALEKLDDDERSMFNIGHENRALFDNRVKDINIISESGLYTLILRCRDAVTPGTIPYRFRKWVTSEVLPQIRRTGRYVREELSPADKAQKVVASFMPAILEAMKEENKLVYSYPLKPNYREHIHTSEGVLILVENSMVMDLLREMSADGHNVDAALAEVTTMLNYIVGASSCLREAKMHMQYVMDKVSGF